ncbi:hypothetical protein [Helicobacter suis]|uniref:hypothetical protein n=1 Tax=Helicobacter suis TaxID=104628 RepID=UPI0013D0B857|nr:hypothetical protein [Helicobacter suis]
MDCPAMLIQVDNQPDQKSNPDAWTKWDKTLQELKDRFEQVNWSWVQYFGDEIDYNRRDNDLPKSVLLPKISKINDTTDCIIFKVGPATGWDIPRACMLLRLRNVCSSKLSIQALGRIKRNPYPQLEKHGITDKYLPFPLPPFHLKPLFTGLSTSLNLPFLTSFATLCHTLAHS